MGFLFKKKKKSNLELPLPPPPPLKRQLGEELTKSKFPEFPSLPDFPEIRPRKENLSEKISKKTGVPIPRQKEFELKSAKPVFVSARDYKEINENVKVIESKLSEANESVHNLENLKQEHAKVLENWRAHLEDIERKMNKIDDIILRHTKR